MNEWIIKTPIDVSNPFIPRKMKQEERCAPPLVVANKSARRVKVPEPRADFCATSYWCALKDTFWKGNFNGNPEIGTIAECDLEKSHENWPETDERSPVEMLRKGTTNGQDTKDNTTSVIEFSLVRKKKKTMLVFATLVGVLILKARRSGSRMLYISVPATVVAEFTFL